MPATMTSTLPDPDRQAVFYDGVPAKRLVAWVADVVLIFVLMLIIGVLTLTVTFWLWPLFWVATSFLYRSLTIGAGSATLGMRLVNIELRGRSGARLTGTEAMLHTAAYLISASFFLPQLLSVALMAMSPRGQGLPDLFLGSAAINRPR